MLFLIRDNVMGNKQSKIKKKAAAAVLHKTGSVPLVTLAVADLLSAFTQSIRVSSTTQTSLDRAMQNLFKDGRLNRPQKGPLKKIKLHPKWTVLERLALCIEGGLLILDVLPADPIATLDGRPFRHGTEAKDEDNIGEVGESVQENGTSMTK
jgi:hypothetical protein